MKKEILIPFFLILLFSACKNDKPDAGSTEPNAPNDTVEEPIQKEPTKLIVNINNIRLRSEAGKDADEIARLPKGTIVYDMGEVSDFTTPIKLRGFQFNEPWIKVKTEKGVEGWIYAGGLNFEIGQATHLAETLMEIRLQNLFGKTIARNIKIYRTQYEKAKTSTSFAKTYQDGLMLRDTMVTILGDKIAEVYDGSYADLFWLEQSMPGYKTQLVAEGTTYYLFNDYKQFQQKAITTTGKEDDLMGDLFINLFTMDSIEYFYPSWFMQTWDYGGSSLLGKGIHFDLLQKMESNYESGLFNQTIDDLRYRLVADIINTNNSYWLSKKAILDELDQILDKGFKQLAKEDVIAIETRRKMFEDPKANKIELNLRAGG